MVDNRPLQHVDDSGAIFVAMNPSVAARFKRYLPQPELATLHTLDFRTKVNSLELDSRDTLLFRRWSLLADRDPESCAKCKP